MAEKIPNILYKTIEGTYRIKKSTILWNRHGSVNIAHIPIKTGSAKTIWEAIISYLQIIIIATNCLSEAGWEGSVLITGNKLG